MTTGSDGASGGTEVSPVGVCVVRSEPLDHGRLYSVTVNPDVLRRSGQRSHRSQDIDEVLRIVASFLRDTQG